MAGVDPRQNIEFEEKNEIYEIPIHYKKAYLCHGQYYANKIYIGDKSRLLLLHLEHIAKILRMAKKCA